VTWPEHSVEIVQYPALSLARVPQASKMPLLRDTGHLSRGCTLDAKCFLVDGRCGRWVWAGWICEMWERRCVRGVRVRRGFRSYAAWLPPPGRIGIPPRMDSGAAACIMGCRLSGRHAAAVALASMVDPNPTHAYHGFLPSSLLVSRRLSLPYVSLTSSSSRRATSAATRAEEARMLHEREPRVRCSLLPFLLLPFLSARESEGL
jgi:hypothetical protein